MGEKISAKSNRKNSAAKISHRMMARRIKKGTNFIKTQTSLIPETNDNKASVKIKT